MPPAPLPPSNIRAYVRWREPSAYAGEEIECIITFKNVAPVPGAEKEQQERQESAHASRGNKPTSEAPPSATQSRRSSIVQSRAAPTRTVSATGGVNGPQGRGHRPALSLNVVSGPSRGGLQSAPLDGPLTTLSESAGLCPLPCGPFTPPVAETVLVGAALLCTIEDLRQGRFQRQVG